jgi:hypothetical protein
MTNGSTPSKRTHFSESQVLVSEIAHRPLLPRILPYTAIYPRDAAVKAKKKKKTTAAIRFNYTIKIGRKKKLSHLSVIFNKVSQSYTSYYHFYHFV